MGATPGETCFPSYPVTLAFLFLTIAFSNGVSGNSTLSGNPTTANKPSSGNSSGAVHKSSAVGAHDSHIQGIYVLDPSERFCVNNPKRPFYQRTSDGAVCCRGKQLPVISVIPEVTGECAISTKTDIDGMLDSENLVSRKKIYIFCVSYLKASLPVWN